MSEEKEMHKHYHFSLIPNNAWVVFWISLFSGLTITSIFGKYTQELKGKGNVND